MPTFWEELYADLEPLSRAGTTDDLQRYCQALGYPFEIVQMLVRDSDNDKVGWSILLDPNRVPEEFLPWLMQLAGVVPVRGESGPQMRNRIKEAEGFDRGTPQSISARASQLGMPNTLLQERYTGSAWRVRFLFVAAEYDEDRLAELVRLLPAGIVHEVGFWAGTTYSMSEATAGTYTAAEAGATTYGNTEEF